jgi:hypothetical protein
MLVGAGLTLTLSLSAPALPAQAEGGDCKVIDAFGTCVAIAVDPGRPGRDQRPAPPPQPADEDADPPAPPRRPPFGAAPRVDGIGVAVVEELDIPPGLLDEPAPDAIAPEILAQRAIRQLGLQAPTIHTSAATTAYIGVPTWLWIDRSPTTTGPASATATAGAAQVTATAELTAVEWQPGPPSVRITCPGPGTPFTEEGGAAPDCSYTYEQRSLPDRTNGTGRWPLTATTIWDITWTGTSDGAPVAGSQILRLTSETSLAVGEVQVLITGS